MPTIQKLDAFARTYGFDSLLDTKAKVGPNGQMFTAQDVFDDAVHLTEAELQNFCIEGAGAPTSTSTQFTKE